MKAKVMSNQNLNESTRKVLSDVVPMDMPFRVFIEPSGYCNLKCVFCAAHAEENAPQTGGGV